MKRRTQVLLLCALALLSVLLPCRAAEVPADESYVFTGAEFGAAEAAIDGVYLCSVPEEGVGSLRLGSRTVQPGDVLSADALSYLRFDPACDETLDALICFRPIRDDRLGEETQLTMHIQSTKNEAPTAEDLTIETYKNIPNSGTLRASDPEGDVLSFRLADKPRRGTVELSENGEFVYTPKKNKVGEDHFTFTVTDLAGNVSAPATVSVTITQPLDAETFDDLAPETQFGAMWLREQGLFGGERVTDKLCFCPEKTVTRGEFLAMAMELAGIDPEIGLETSLFRDQQDAPSWQQPYLSSALRRGIVRGYAGAQGLEFRPNEAITARDAGRILARIFGVPEDGQAAAMHQENANPDAAAAVSLTDTAAPDAIAGSDDVPTWTADGAALLDRAACAALLYRAAHA